MDAPYNYTQVQAWLEVDGARVPVVRAMVTYELNALPTATVTLPVGRDALTGKPSPVHTLFQITEPTPVKLKMKLLRSGHTKSLGIPTGTVTLFEGFTDGLGYQKSIQPHVAEFSFSLRHWLSELDYSSIFSQYSHPSNPADYSAAAIHPNSSAYGSKSQTIGPYDVDGSLDYKNVASELWGKALQPFFIGLCKTDGLRIWEQKWSADAPPAEGDAGAEKSYANDVAKAALERIKSRPGLKIRMQGGDNLAEMLRRDLYNRTSDRTAMANHTIWGCLVGELASEYLFALVPRVSDALVVPFVAAPRKAFRTVTPDEYSATMIQGATPRPIRAFGILGGANWLSNANGRPASSSEMSRLAVGGWYTVEGRKRGIVRIEAPPSWAAGAMGEVAKDVQKAAGAQNRLIATADQPKAAGKPDKDQAKTRAKRAQSAVTFLGRYARTRLAHEQFVARQGTVTGPLRMDLAPGSAIELIATTDPFLEYDSLRTSFYGTVLRISTEVDAAAMTARTSYHLSHVRTAEENAVEANALDFHPLYEDVYTGAPLLEA